MDNIIIIEDSFFLSWVLFLFSLSTTGLFITQLGVAIIDKWGSKNLNIFYRLKSEEMDAKIEDIKEAIQNERSHGRKIDALLEEIKHHQQILQNQIKELKK